MHKTQLLMHNPQALRVEFHIDEGRLILWWSPKAGESYDCRDRFFSSRDDHLDLFQEIQLPGCTLAQYLRTDYDPYHSVLHFKSRELHIAVHDLLPVCLVWSSAPQAVDFKTHRFDAVREAGADAFVVAHGTPAYGFEFAALLGEGGGSFRHPVVRGEWRSTYARLEQVVRMGDIRAPAAPGMTSLRRTVIRGLHSMIDESGAYRASMKEIYYLIWVRDGGFSYPFQAAAGWPHKLEEFCRLLLANPTTARGEGIPPGRTFGQLIHRDYGKYEEDGIYYVIWNIFTHWTQTGDDGLLTPGHIALLEEALAWVERHIFDERSGLFGEYTADETAATGSRDDQWDYAIGKPLSWDGPYYNGRKIARYYDIYINTLMHSAWTMLAAMLPDAGRAEAYRAKADALWDRMRIYFDRLDDGLPPYGDLLTTNGEMLRAAPMGPPYGRSVYIWGLTLPNFLPCAGLDAIRIRLLQRIAAEPDLHFINGICSTILSVDPWLHPEREMLDMLEAIREQAMRHGKYMVMPGAMPEKFNAPEGNLYHDIRPQGFAMGTWLASWSSLGVRRLPYGLALRPTRAFAALDHYPWRGRTLHFRFGATSRALGLDINGNRVPHTLQVPMDALGAGDNTISLVDGGETFLWLRSTVELRSVQVEAGRIAYAIQARGLSEVGFSAAPASMAVLDASGREVPFSAEGGAIHTIRFSACGAMRVVVNP